MTRKESAKMLKTWRVTGKANHEAFDKAIKSLEAWEKVYKRIKKLKGRYHYYGAQKAYIKCLNIIDECTGELEEDPDDEGRSEGD